MNWLRHLLAFVGLGKPPKPTFREQQYQRLWSQLAKLKQQPQTQERDKAIIVIRRQLNAIYGKRI